MEESEPLAGSARVPRRVARGWVLCVLAAVALLAWRLPERLRADRHGAERTPSLQSATRDHAESLLRYLRGAEIESFAAGLRKEDLLGTSGRASKDKDSFALVEAEAVSCLRGAEAARRKLLELVLPDGTGGETGRILQADQELRALRACVEAAGSASCDRPAALRVEWMDARIALRTCRPGLAASNLEAILADSELPRDLDRAWMARRLDEAREAAALIQTGAEAAGQSAKLFASGFAKAIESPEAAWRVDAGRWCALAAVRSFAAEAGASTQNAELRRLTARFSTLKASRLGPDTLDAFADLAAWAAARLLDAQLRGDAGAALDFVDSLRELLGARSDPESPSLALRAAGILEARGRERLARGEAAAGDDLRAAASKRLALLARARTEEASRIRGEAAEILELAGDFAGAAALLAPIVPRPSDATLRLARAWTALREHAKVVDLLDALILARGPLDAASRDGRAKVDAKLGPIFEEARLLRSAACLGLASSLPPHGAKAIALDKKAAEDLEVLLENLTPASDVCGAALYFRGLQLELQALEAWPAWSPWVEADGARGLLAAAAERLERLVGACSLPDEWRASALDRLARIDERLGRFERAREHLELLASISGPGPRERGSSRLRPLLQLPRGILRELIASAPYRKADAALFAGDRGRALGDYLEALSWNGDSVLAPWAHYQVAMLLRDGGDSLASTKAMELGRASLESSRAEPALEMWRQALRGRLERL